MNVMDPDAVEEESLINQIELEMRKVYLSVEKLYNNASLFESDDPVEKCFINDYYYSSSLLQRELRDNTDTNEDALKALEKTLQQELDCLTSDMDRLLIRMHEHKEKFDSIDKNITNLNAMVEAQKTEKKSEQNFNVIMKNIKLRFRKEKSDLKAIVSSLFPENGEVHDLIANIIEHHFNEGSDKYLQVEDTDDNIEQIELLRRSCLFETNPHDPLQIRLADMV